MFECILNNVDVMRESFSAVSEFIDDVKLKIREDGIFIDAADRAVVVVSALKIDKEAFGDYKFDQNKDLGLNLTSFLNVLKRAAPNDKVRFVIPEDMNKIHLELMGNSTRCFELPIIDVSDDELPDITSLKFSTTFKIPSSSFDNIINDAELFTDFIIFRIESDKVFVESSSDYGSFNIALENNKGISELQSEQSVKSRYSLDYLKKIMKAKKIGEEVKVSFGNDYPLNLTFEDPGTVSLTFILAPRVEES